MHFSYAHHAHDNKAGKFALVAGLHVLLAAGIVNMMNTRGIPLPTLPTNMTVFTTPEPVDPPVLPPDPPRQVQQIAPPDIVVPKIEIEVTPPPVENPVRATVQTDPAPFPPQPTQAQSQPAASTGASAGTGTGNGTMRSIAMADASGCATPDYPARAARNGDSGTVTLALLIGTDGRVSNARVQKSSGSRDLDKAALNALSMCQFKPGMNNGVPEAGWGQIAYVWSLE